MLMFQNKQLVGLQHIYASRGTMRTTNAAPATAMNVHADVSKQANSNERAC
jgi:hypothetical protein